MPGEGALIGIDLGTTAVKAVAHALDGRALAEASQRYALHTPRPEWAEQDPEEIYRAGTAALRSVLQDLRGIGEQPLAIGLSSAMHGMLAVDERGAPISPAITWMDRRSAAIAEEWRADGTGARLYRRTGAPMHPMLPLCKLRWLQAQRRDLFDRAARFVGMKELFVFRWTGEWLIDRSIAAGTGMFDVRGAAWDREALALAGIDAARLSVPAPCATRRTVTRAEAKASLGIDERTEIVLASSDGALANLGIGAIGRTTPALTLGTSGALRVVGDEPLFDDAGRTFCYPFDDERWLIGGPTSSGGAVVEWMLALVAPEIPAERRIERAAALASEIAPGADGLTVLPFLGGERAPYWRAGLRGRVCGLDLAHDRRHLVRATLEGIAFALLTVQHVMRELAGKPEAILLSGGLTREPFVRQLIADAFETETREPDRREASAFGAAMMAGTAIGAIPSVRHVAKLISYPSAHRPDAELAPAYRAAYARYAGLVEALLAEPG